MVSQRASREFCSGRCVPRVSGRSGHLMVEWAYRFIVMERGDLTCLTITETIVGVIVDHTHRLYERVADRRSYKAKSAALQVLAHRVRFRRPRRYLARVAPIILLRAAANKLPDIPIKRTEFLLYREKCLRVGNRRGDFQPVAHDARIRQQLARLCAGRNARFSRRRNCLTPAGNSRAY